MPVVTGAIPMLDLDLIFGLGKADAPQDQHSERTDANARYVAVNPNRQEVLNLLHPIERINPALARDLADTWMERVAICEIDGSLSSKQAEQIAFDELFIERNQHGDSTEFN